jgi:hypothetical protein
MKNLKSIEQSPLTLSFEDEPNAALKRYNEFLDEMAEGS